MAKGMSEVFILIIRPTFLFDKDGLAKYKFIKERKTSWNDFLKNWEYLAAIKGTDTKWFEVRALTNEHAIVCF